MEFRGDLGDFANELSDRLETKIRQATETRLWVAVLGQGANGALHYEKRLQVRDELNQVPGVRALMPEDPAVNQLIQRKVGIDPLTDLVIAERLLLRCVDVVIALEPGSGVEQEVAMFSQDTELSWRLISVLPEAYSRTAETSFAGQVRRAIECAYYSDEEFHECSVATRICPGLIRKRQLIKWLDHP